MFISFAQQFEDVLLWRALKHVEQGFYIDIGAQHPEIDSVSKAFYDHGWRGVHVEPIRHYANLIREHRPDEVVLEVAVAEQSGLIAFYDIPDTGLSTADFKIAESHQREGRTVNETTVPCIPLADILGRYSDREIHWLKIDVEGLEASVLRGWGESPVRPWIVVVESTLPNTQTDTHEDWENQLLSRQYTSVLYDGLNRYYVSEQHPELREALRYGPTVFDNFVLSTTGGSYCGLFREKIEQENIRAQHFEQEWSRVSSELQEIRDRLTQHSQRLKESQDEALQFRKQITTLRNQLAQREQAFNREHERARQLQEKWGNAKAKIEKFRKRANEAEREANRLGGELASVYSSKSWKFGAPLRVGQRVAKKIYRLLKGSPAPVALSSVQPETESAVQNVQHPEPVTVQANKESIAPSADVDLTHVSSTTRQVYQQLTNARHNTN